MIENALNTIRTKLNVFFRNIGEAQDDRVAYIDSSLGDAISFPLNKVSLILINIEEERALRQADPYAGQLRNGVLTGKNPEIRITLLVLFVARFREYEQSMKSLSQIIRYFQANRIFRSEDTPELDEDIGKLLVELQTMPIAEQNELWNALRSAYNPSVAYKLSLLAYHDEMSMSIGGAVQAVRTQIDGIKE